MDWIQEIKKNENKALKQIYATYRKDVIRWLKKRYDLNVDDAGEVYQLATIILYEKVVSGQLTVLSSDLKSYLIGVSKNKALEMFRKRSKFVSTEVLEHIESKNELEFIELKEKRIEESLIALNNLGDPCRSLIQHFYFNRLNMEKITALLGYKNAATTKNLKYKCIKRLQSKVVGHI